MSKHTLAANDVSIGQSDRPLRALLVPRGLTHTAPVLHTVVVNNLVLTFRMVTISRALDAALIPHPDL